MLIVIVHIYIKFEIQRNRSKDLVLSFTISQCNEIKRNSFEDDKKMHVVVLNLNTGKMHYLAEMNKAIVLPLQRQNRPNCPALSWLGPASRNP